MSNLIGLQEFVDQTLRQIEQGVVEARRRSRHRIAVFAPTVTTITTETYKGEITTKLTNITPVIQQVEFDLAVTVENAKSKSDAAKGDASAKIAVLSADVSGELRNDQRDASTVASRIRFSVLLMLKGEDVTIENKKEGEPDKKPSQGGITSVPLL